MLWRKCAAILFSIFIFCLSLEFFLFLHGQYLQYGNQRVVIGDYQTTIVVVGESTSAAGYAGDIPSWPEILSELLKKNGVKAKVVNLAKSATNSAYELKAYDHQTQMEKVDLTISMLGINDAGSNLFYHPDKSYQPRFLRLVKNYYRLLFAKTPDSRGIANDTMRLKLTALSDEIRRNKSIDWQKIREFLVQNDQISRLEALRFLAYEVKGPWSRENPNLHLSFEIYRKLFAEEFDLSYLPEFLFEASKLKEPDVCRQVARKLLEINFNGEQIMNSLAKCIPEDDLYKELAHQQSEHFEVKNVDDLDYVLRGNFNRLIRLATERNQGCMMVMQYPLLPMPEQTMRIDNPHEIKNLYYLENKVNFEKAIAERGEQEVFIDKFAPKFGHTTAFGSRLIAENVFSEIQKMIQEKKCGF